MRDPNLAQYVNKQLTLYLQGPRKVTGILRGFDNFLNVLLEEAYDTTDKTPKKLGKAMIRGVSIVSLVEN